MPTCNSCGRLIEDWEVMCNRCWSVIIAYDRKFYTKYTSMTILHFHKFGRRDYFTKSIIETLRERITPPSWVGKIEKIKRKQRKVCIRCERENGKKDIDECFNCAYHILFNLMVSEINNNGH